MLFVVISCCLIVNGIIKNRVNILCFIYLHSKIIVSVICNTCHLWFAWQIMLLDPKKLKNKTMNDDNWSFIGPQSLARVERLWIHEVWWTSLKDLCSIMDVTVIIRMVLVKYVILYLTVLFPNLFSIHPDQKR